MSRPQIETWNLCFVAFILFLLARPGTAAATTSPCEDPMTLLPGESRQRTDRPTVVRDCYRIPVDRPGILDIYASTGLRRERVRTIVLPSNNPGRETPSPWQVRRQTPRELMVEVSGPGELQVVVEAEIPGIAVPEYSLTTRFAEIEAPGSTRLSDVRKDVDPWDDDGTSGFASERDRPGCFRKDVDPWDDDGTSGFAGDDASDPLGLCDPADGDRPRCAAPIVPGAEAATRTIEPGSEDHLTFALDNQETVMLDLGDDSGVGMMLFDGRGHALETPSTDLLVRTLGAGRYYVLLTTVTDGAPSGEQASYGLRLDRIP